MTIQEGDKQAGNAFGEFVIKRFVTECRKHPRFLEDPVAVMQMVFQATFNCEAPSTWAAQVGKREERKL